jgi:ABC-type antimicrobial peptide transport system, permease component
MKTFFDIDFWHEVFSTIANNKRRSLLTAFGVFWGIFMLIVMAGCGFGIQNGIMGGVDYVEANTGVVFSGRTTQEYKGFRAGRVWQITTKDMDAIKATIPEIIRIGGVTQKYGTPNNIVHGTKSSSFNIYGVDDDYMTKIFPVRLLQGRCINGLDNQYQRKVCVIGRKVLNDVYMPGETVLGTMIKVSGVYYTVVGVVENMSAMVNMGSPAEEIVFIPRTTCRQAFNTGEIIDLLAYQVAPSDDIDKATEKVKELLKQRHDIAPTDDNAMFTMSMKEILKTMGMMFTGLNILIWIVGLGTLLAGVIGVTNIMLITIGERTQEIGIRRALGATPSVIIQQIMCESIALTFMAGVCGVLLGVGVLEIIGKFTVNIEQFTFNPQISFSLAIVSLLILIFFGLLAGIVPSRKALKIKAIDALRDE